MEGFDRNSVVIVLGATNHVDVLDETLRRSWIFDCVVMVETTYMVRRQAIWQVHVTKKGLPFGSDVDPANIACLTIGFTGELNMNNMTYETKLQYLFSIYLLFITQFIQQLNFGKCNGGVLCQSFGRQSQTRQYCSGIGSMLVVLTGQSTTFSKREMGQTVNPFQLKVTALYEILFRTAWKSFASLTSVIFLPCCINDTA
ncbi:ATP-dependent zinc metalloprotease FTSH 9, chloroplastic-like protein [Tanacetum coccineum]